MSDPEKIAGEAGDGLEGKGPLRIGLLATDPLRVLGLQAIVATRDFQKVVFGGRHGALVVPLSLPGMLEDTKLSVVLIDANCTAHLLELIAMFRRTRPQIRLIILGDSVEMDYIQGVIGAGAKGYLNHDATESEIRLALEIVCDGSMWAPRKVLARLLDASHPEPAGQPAIRFTAREIEVLQLLVSGMPNRQIGVELAIDEGTVKAHLSRLMRKVGATNRIELTLKALEHDL